ncbi:hypothetical protein BD779DRAFT_1445787, partial [Infundibulicybe gibba]
GKANITKRDLERLRPSSFLNDALVMFGLRYYLNELESRNPELAEQFHLFDSYFYRDLSQGCTGESYVKVQKWTTRINIFQKKYIIVPINQE